MDRQKKEYRDTMYGLIIIQIWGEVKRKKTFDSPYCIPFLVTKLSPSLPDGEKISYEKISQKMSCKN